MVNGSDLSFLPPETARVTELVSSTATLCAATRGSVFSPLPAMETRSHVFQPGAAVDQAFFATKCSASGFYMEWAPSSQGNITGYSNFNQKQEQLPLTREAGWDIRRFSDVLRDGIMVHAKELEVAKVLINGKLICSYFHGLGGVKVAEDDPSASNDNHEVEFLLPLLQDEYIKACSQKEVLGILHFRGSVYSHAYLNSKEPVSQALVDIKEDIIRSLQSRLDIMCDEADRKVEHVSCDGLETNSRVSSDKPDSHFDIQVQRDKSLSFGDLMTENNATYHFLEECLFHGWRAHIYVIISCHPRQWSVLGDHCIELMLIEVPADASKIMEPESEAPSVIASTSRTFWGIATDCSSTAMLDSSVSKSWEIGRDRHLKSTDFKSVVAVLVLILSILTGLVFYIIGRV
ncbi:hypothetical protein OROMI_013486 [Orobanche minor]